MIRFFGLLLVLAAGLAAAVLWAGQLHHLRQAMPDALPPWTRALPGDASLRQGRAVLPGPVGTPVLTLAWRALAPTSEGLRWGLELTGRGVDLSAEALIGWTEPGTLVLREGLGTVDLSALAGAEVSGLIALQRLDASVTGLGAPELVGHLSARVVGLAFADAGLGDGEAVVTLGAEGLVGKAALAGGVSAATAEIMAPRAPGAILGPGSLILVIDDAQALPPRARAALDQAGQVEGGALVLRLALPGL